MIVPTLIETSAWIEFLSVNGDTTISNQAETLLANGDAYITEIVSLELSNGATTKEHQKQVNRIIKNLPSLKTTSVIWEKANHFAQKFRSQGVTIPNADILIFAVSIHYQFAVLSKDKHFEIMQKLV